MEGSLASLVVLILAGPEDEPIQRLEKLGESRPVELHVVRTPSELRGSLDEQAWDVIVVYDSARRKNPALTLELDRVWDLEIPVVILSSSSRAGERAEAVAAGAFDVVAADDLTRLATCIEHAGWISRLRQRCAQSEERLRATEQLFRRVLNAAPISIFATDERGVLTLHEGKALEKVGMVPGEAVGQSAFAVFSDLPVHLPDALSTGGEALRRVLAGETLRAETVLNEVVFDNQFAPLVDADGHARGFVGVAVDITERKRFEEELQQSRADLRVFAHRLAGMEEEERRRIARQLHDSIGQTLSAAALNLAVLRRELAADTHSSIVQRLEDSMRMLETVTGGLRMVIADLQPPMLEREGLMPTLRWLADVHGRRTGLKVEVSGGDPSPPPPAPVSTALVRIAQEALTNVAKHGRASQVTISVDDQHDVVTMTISDDGAGFVLSQVCSTGLGLTIMHERAVAVGAHISIESRLGAGTSVSATWRRRTEAEG